MRRRRGSTSPSSATASSLQKTLLRALRAEYELRDWDGLGPSGEGHTSEDSLTVAYEAGSTGVSMRGTLLVAAVFLCLTAAFAGCASSDNDSKGDRIPVDDQSESTNWRVEGLPPPPPISGHESSTPSGSEPSGKESGMSTTCRFTSGPRAGEIQFFPRGTPGVRPAPVGSPCTFSGSSGVVIK